MTPTQSAATSVATRRWLFALIFAAVAISAVLDYLIYAPFLGLEGEAFRHYWKNDGYEYLTIGEHILRGEGFRIDGGPTAWRAPLYPLFLAGAFAVFGVNFWAYMVPQALLLGLLVYLGFLTGWRLFGSERLGLLTAALIAFNPGIWRFAIIPMSETIVLPLNALAFLACLAAVRELEGVGLPGARRGSGSAKGAIGAARSAIPAGASGRRKALAWAGLAGLLLGLSALAKPTSLIFLPFFLLFLAWKTRSSASGRVLAGALIALVPLVAIAPWTVRNYLVFSEPVLVTTAGFGQALLTWNNPTYRGEGFLSPYGESRVSDDPETRERFDRLMAEAVREGRSSEAAADRIAGRVALEYIAANPGEYLTLVARRFFGVWSPVDPATQFTLADPEGASVKDVARSAAKNLYWLVFAPLFLFGLVRVWREGPDSVYLALLWSAAAILFCLLVGLDRETRFRVLAEPFMAPVAAVALSRLLERLAPGGAAPDPR